ncbi:hypothetical protein M5Z10_07835 [Neisseria meningitidis]|nr:hypothetical protein [Neisseria meningitidis]
MFAPAVSLRSGLGLAWLGLAWLGLAWLGLAWLGLAWLEVRWICRLKLSLIRVASSVVG